MIEGTTYSGWSVIEGTTYSGWSVIEGTTYSGWSVNGEYSLELCQVLVVK